MSIRARPNGSPLTPGQVSLGRGSSQACSGDDPRLADARQFIAVDGVTIGKPRNVDFKSGTNVTLSGVDVVGEDKVEITIDSTGGAGTVDWYEGSTLKSTQSAVQFDVGGALALQVVDFPASSRAQVLIKLDQASLTSIAPLSPSSDKLAFYTSSTTASTTDLTPFARTLLDDVDAAAARTTLGIVGGGAQSVTTIDFGAFPGKSDASLDITGQTGIDSASVVTAWLQPADTDDHTADEHRLETISVMAGNVIPGVGFTIYATNNSQRNEPLSKPGIAGFRPAATTFYGYAGESVGGRGTRIYGKWSVAWKWS